MCKAELTAVKCFTIPAESVRFVKVLVSLQSHLPYAYYIQLGEHILKNKSQNKTTSTTAATTTTNTATFELNVCEWLYCISLRYDS